MTNFEKIKEKIKNMSVDEMAEKLYESFVCDRCPLEEFCDKDDLSSMPISSCSGIWKKWLESEVEE